MAEAAIAQARTIQATEPTLTNQVAVVSGASRGIGEAVARALGRMGATVVLTARDQARLALVKAEIEEVGGKAAAAPCDLTDTHAIAALGKRVGNEHGRCDILVNCAGISLASKPLVEVPPEEWDAVFSINLRAPYLMIRALAPLMIAARSGHIINISSLAGRNPLPNWAVYSASKWGLNGLTYSIAEELRQYNVRAMVIAPGSVNTHFDAGRSSGRVKDPSKMIQPDDVAAVVATIVTQAPNSFISEVLMRPTTKP